MSSASRAIVPTSCHRTCALAGRAIVGMTSPTFMGRLRVAIPASPLCCPATRVRGRESSPAVMHFHCGAHDQSRPGTLIGMVVLVDMSARGALELVLHENCVPRPSG